MEGTEYDLNDFLRDYFAELPQDLVPLQMHIEKERVKRVFDLLAQKTAVYGRVDLHEIGVFRLGKPRKYPRTDRPGKPETYRKIKFNAAPAFEQRVAEIVGGDVR
jgi:nucleoid DNA-binding protein